MHFTVWFKDFDETTIDVSNFSEGIYFVTILQNNGFYQTIKITVK